MLSMTATVQSQIPQEADWRDYGMVLDVGPFGQAWDALMEGITPASIMKQGDIYYLYYVGSKNYISQKNNIGPAYRSIGVATSRDGIRWSKYPGNPVLTFTSSGNPEEGVPSAGVFVDDAGKFIAYYGANIARNATTPSVHADIRLATSLDGLNFVGTKIVLSYANPAIWGWGDELHAVAGLFHSGMYYAYYVPNGTALQGLLGVAWGGKRDQHNNFRAVLSNGATVPAGGPLSIIQLDSNTLAFFNAFQNELHVRLGSINDPSRLGPVVASYTDLDGSGKSVFLDKDRKTWLMYTNYWSYIGLRLAPFGDPDTTPPTAPPDFNGIASSDTISLHWGDAVDTDTGVIKYNIYQGDNFIGDTFGLTYKVTGLAERTMYTLEVRAVNLHGTEGPGSFVTVVTGNDTVAPAIDHIRAGGNNQQVTLTFNEPIERKRAEDSANYTIFPDVSVVSAALQPNHRTVLLTVSPQAINTLYTVSVTNVQDRSVAKNLSNAQATYTYASNAGLVGYWRLDRIADSKVPDSSGSRNDGLALNGLTVEAGRVGHAISLNGTSHYVEIDATASLDNAFRHNFTVSAWGSPADVPPNTTNSNFAYTIFRSPNMVLRYRSDQKFEVRVQTAAGSVNLASGMIPPGQWRHLVAVLALQPNQLHLYLDGQPVDGSPVY